jgi:hypothetical protein
VVLNNAMKTLLFIVSLAGVGIVWALNRIAATDLQTQIATARQENVEVAALQRERERLQRLQREAEESARRERAALELARAQQERAAREKPLHRSPPSVLTVGEWLPPAGWKNRGQATPTATVETALWAAAGGDVAMLQGMLQLDESVRVKAAEILARLPESARVLYASPEHLIAAFTTKSIPLGDAQLVWQHQPGPDEAVACVFVKNPDTSIASASATPLPDVPPESREEAIQRASRRDPNKNPPMAPPNNKTIATYLSLRRMDDGWRLVVPVSAVEKIAKELGGSR